MLRVKQQWSRLPVRDSPSVEVLKEQKTSGKTGMFAGTQDHYRTLFYFDSVMQCLYVHNIHKSLFPKYDLLTLRNGFKHL